MPKVLITDPIAQEGVDYLARGVDVDVRLRPSPEELLALIPNYEALVVRSETKVTAAVIEAGVKLQVVGRAGSGVDNIDLDAATQRGVVVVNAPGGNTISATEHAIALMLALARHVPEAYDSLRAGRWERAKFVGIELRGKTLGLIGLGRVGTEVSRRARAMEMRVIANDPYVAAERAQSLGVELVSLDELLAQADFISLHVTMAGANRDLLSEEQFANVKPGVRIINTARGELIDEDALLRALDDGRVAAAALDVFKQEPPTESPLLTHAKTIVTPHLGASTEEAQERVAVDVAEQVLTVLRGEPAMYAVNAPFVAAETMAVLRPFLAVAERTASLATQLCDGQLQQVSIEYLGELANHDVMPLKAAAIKGLLASVSEENVTIVNANMVAERRGLRIDERKGPSEDYPNVLVVRLTTDHGVTTVAGTAFHDGTHITQVNDYSLNIPPGDGYLLICENVDRPGMVGAVGVLLGEHGVNIKLMVVSPPVQEAGRAMMVLQVDGVVPDADMLRELESVPDLYSARLAKL
ncbi:MAG: phosphoglycerate dehydrogenase [Dehalococcoidia bacterium]